MLKYIFNTIFFILFAISMNSCVYEMPDEENPRAVPQTNNPNEIKNSGSSLPMPGVQY